MVQCDYSARSGGHELITHAVPVDLEGIKWGLHPEADTHEWCLGGILICGEMSDHPDVEAKALQQVNTEEVKLEPLINQLPIHPSIPWGKVHHLFPLH